MPVSVYEAPIGYDTTRSSQVPSCHLIEWHLSGVKVDQVLPSGQSIDTLQPNGFIVKPARSPVGLVAHGPARFAHFCFTDEQLRSVAVDWLGDAGDRDDLLPRDRLMRREPIIAAMLDQYLRRAMDEAEPAFRMEMDSLAYLILLQLLKRYSVVREKESKALRGGLSPFHLRRVCELMTRDLEVEVPIGELAASVGISYHHFCHAFKASTGLAPRQWLVEQRVERASTLLRTTRHSVTEIAALVGYEDPNQLLRVFRSRRGTTPAAYRREFQLQLVPATVAGREWVVQGGVR